MLFPDNAIWEKYGLSDVRASALDAAAACAGCLVFSAVLAVTSAYASNPQWAIWCSYSCTLWAFQRQEHTLGFGLHLGVCRPATAVVLATMVYAQCDALQACAAAAAVMLVLPASCLWFPRRIRVLKSAQKVKKRPAAALALKFRRPAAALLKKPAAAHTPVSFWASLALLRTWLQRRDEWPLRKSKCAQEKKLARFVNNMRERNRKKGLQQDMADALEALACTSGTWSWNSRAASWLDNFGMYSAFLDAAPAGTPAGAMPSWHPCLDPPGFLPEEERQQELQLAKWAAYQKHLDSKGRLCPDRKDKLAALQGWEWSTRIRGAQRLQLESWEGSYKDLLQWPQSAQNVRKKAQPRNWCFRSPEERALACWFDSQIKAVRYAAQCELPAGNEKKKEPSHKPIDSDKKAKILKYLTDHNLMHLLKAKMVAKKPKPFAASLASASSSAGPIDLD